jgi:uncharacterized membrane protein
MLLSKKQAKLLQEVIANWQAEGVVTHEEAERLNKTYTIRKFDWKKLAKYSFWIALVCAFISVATALADDYIIDFIERLFNSSYIGLSIVFALASAGVYYMGLKRKKLYLEKIFSNEALILVGAALTAGSIAYLGKFLDIGSGHYSLLILLAAVVYFIIGLSFPSMIVWVLALLSLGAWFGAETEFVTHGDDYFLGMNYPLRFVLFSYLLLGLSRLLKRPGKLLPFYRPTFVVSLLYLFISLWMLSIFGNYENMNRWNEVTQFHLWGYGVIFAAAGLFAIWYGLRFDDYVVRSFGITFFIIGLYTRYFEYFWDNTHKAIFFLLLALSFWLIGSHAEKIWNLEFRRKGNEGVED